MHFARTYELLLEGQLDATENKYLFDQLLSFWPDGPFKNFDLNFGIAPPKSENGGLKHLGTMKIKRKSRVKPHICYQASELEYQGKLPKYAYWMQLAVSPRDPELLPRNLYCFWMSNLGILAMKDVVEEIGSEHDLLGVGDDIHL